MPSVMDRLFGRNKIRTADSIGAALAAARETLTEAQARAAAAADRRTVAIASGDRSSAIAAEAERGAAGIDAEIAASEIVGLEKGLQEATKAEQAAAKAATLAALVARRKALGQLLETEYRAAAAVMGSALSAIAELRRDIAEAGFSDRQIDKLPEVARFAAMAEGVGTVSAWLGDALTSYPAVSESPAEAAAREHKARRAAREAETAEARRLRAETEREEGRIAREAEAAEARRRERFPFYGMTLEVPDVPGLSDAAR